MVNRKLVRPNLAELKDRLASQPKTSAHSQPSAPREGGGGGHAPQPHPRRRPAPPDQTNAEAFYYLKQMNNKTPMVVVLDDGEQLRGHLEWYDRSCIKVHRDDGPNLLVFKHCIKYVYKQEEEEHVGPVEAEA